MCYLCTDMNMSPLVTRKIMFIKKCTNFLSSVIQYLVSDESCGLHYYLIIMKTSQQVKIFLSFFFQLTVGFLQINIPVHVSKAQIVHYADQRRGGAELN